MQPRRGVAVVAPINSLFQSAPIMQAERTQSEPVAISLGASHGIEGLLVIFLGGLFK